MAIIYGILQLIISLSTTELYINLAKILYWIGLLIPQFSLLDIFKKIVMSGMDLNSKLTFYFDVTVK